MVNSVSASSRAAFVPFVSLGLLALPWVNINSGPWNLEDPQGWIATLHACRAAVPFVAVLVALAMVATRGGWFGYGWSSPFRLLIVYGVVALGATVFSPNPWYAFYWGVTFLVAFLAFAAAAGRGDSLTRATQLLIATWIIVGVYAVIIAFVIRDVVTFESQGAVLPGYGVLDKVPEVAGMVMSRSSGVARFTAVPAILAFAMLFHARSRWRFLWLVPFGVFTGIVLAMQSRGGLFGFAAALLLVFALHRRRTVWIALVAGLLVLATALETTLPEKVLEYVERGQGEAAFTSMSGRTRAWAEAMEAFADAPVLGRGHWTDRSVIGEHVHNAPLQALLSAGLVGIVPYIVSWIAGWRLFIRLMRRWKALSPGQQILVIQAGSVLTFFTVRSIPETTTASVSVDLLVMIPVFAYLEILDRQLSVARRFGPVAAT